MYNVFSFFKLVKEVVTDAIHLVAHNFRTRHIYRTTVIIATTIVALLILNSIIRSLYYIEYEKSTSISPNQAIEICANEIIKEADSTQILRFSNKTVVEKTYFPSQIADTITLSDPLIAKPNATSKIIQSIEELTLTNTTASEQANNSSSQAPTRQLNNTTNRIAQSVAKPKTQYWKATLFGEILKENGTQISPFKLYCIVSTKRELRKDENEQQNETQYIKYMMLVQI